MHEGVDQSRQRLESRPAQQVNIKRIDSATIEQQDHSLSVVEQAEDEAFRSQAGYEVYGV